MNTSPAQTLVSASPQTTAAQPAAAGEPTWNEAPVALLAQSLQASVSVDACGPVIELGADTWDERAGGVAVLAEYGLITVSGEAGATFLHGQLTQDVEHLRPGMAQWAGYCSAKGRLMATLRTWRAGDEVRLLLSRPLARPIAKRLSMFVLRAKAKVIDTSDASVVFGLIGEPAVRAAIASTTISPPAPEASVVDAGLELVGLPAMPHDETGALPRWLLIVPADQAASTWTRLSATASPISARAWRRSEVLAGVPRIVPGTSEHFVPQMVNFESVDGVSFTKGCYPGQEIVARSQYLGKLKRRMFLGTGHGDLPVPGQDVHTLIDGAEPCGEVVLAAPDGHGGYEVLFESQVEAAEQAGVRIGAHRLTLRPLPYPLRPVG
jgi:hypothetical protein